MSYNSKLLQTGRKVASARRKYYGSFDYGSGIDAKLRGGTFSFGKKLAWGGPDEKTWIPEIDETEVDEPDVQDMIAKYFRKHPNDAWKFGKNPETGLDYGAEFGDSDFSGKGGGWWQLAGIGLDAVSNFMDMDEKRKAMQKKYDAFGTMTFNGLTDNNALLSTMANTPLLGPASTKDFRDKSVGQDILSVLGTGVTTTMNSGGNYWAGLAAMGAKTAQVLGERWNADRLAKEASMEAKHKNLQFLKDMNVASQDVDARNDWMRMLGYYNDPYIAAFGGPLHSNGGDYNGGLTYIDEGGRHEENPYEGVPSGFDEEGNPNLVEEGEVIWNNDYVFSDRLKIPKELADKYKLGGKKDYTFAEAIKKLTKESTVSPNDFITIATTKEIVNEFMEAQEAIREREHLAEREKAEATQTQNFLAQLDAAQGGTPQSGPIDFQLPTQSPEGLPVGFAFGGNKFQNGSWKNYVTEGKDKSGTPIFTTSDGRVFYSEAGARKYVDLNKEYLVSRLPDFIASPAPARVVADAPRQSLPAGIKAVYSKGRNGQRGAIHHYETSDGLNMGTDLDKAIRHQNAIDGVSAPSQEVAAPVVQEPAVPALPSLVSSSTVPASTVTATRTLPAAQPRVQQVAQPQVAAPQVQPEVTINSKGQEEETLPDGIKVVYSKGRNGNRGPVHHYETSDGLNMGTNRDKAVQYQTRLNQENAQVAAAAKAVPSPSFQDINIFGTPDGGFDLFSYTPQDYVSGSTIPFSSDNEKINESEVSDEEVITPPKPEDPIRDRKRKDTRARDAENNPLYKGLVERMDKASAEDKKKFIDELNAGLPDGKKIKDYSTWKRKATDGEWGDVHNATLNYARKQSHVSVPDVKPTEFDSNIPFDYDTYFKDVADVLGQEPVGNNTSGNGTAQEPQFNYRDTRLRYAPPIGAAMDWLYRRFNRPDYSNADRIIEAAYRMGAPINIPVETIGDYRRRNPFDERYLVNMANQNRAAAARGIANTAGGNRAMDLLGNMSLAHSNQQELGEIMRQAYLANRQDDAQVADFNRGTNVYNMGAINQRNLSQAQLNTHRQQAGLSGLTQGYGLRQTIYDNWDDAAMESYNSLLESLGAIGKENEEYNILTSMAEQGYFPWYYGDRSILQYVPQKTSKGGKLNRKKRRF